MRLVIFACVHNAGRSQMAAAFFNAMADADLARAATDTFAGIRPADVPMFVAAQLFGAAAATALFHWLSPPR